VQKIKYDVEDQLPLRKDLRNLFTFTIDGEDARDLDDAISIEKISDGYKLYVRIADVAHYVKAGSQVQNEAYLRATSVYLPHKVLPMLPEKLSNDLCSLNPHTDKLTLTCEMDLDESGKVRNVKVLQSVINSDYRLTYKEVQQMYDKESWINYAKKKDGYIFRKVMDVEADPYHYDGYFAEEGNKFQIDNEDVPFVLKTGRLENNALSSMVLFLDKGGKLTKKSMWEAILDRREVGVIEKGKMIGPAKFRNALQILLLDRVYLEEYFSDRINLKAVTND